MQRSGGIGVTAKMFEAVQSHYDLEELLKYEPVCRITPEILKSQESLKGMKLLLNIDLETIVTEEVIFRALEMGNDSTRSERLIKEQGNGALEALFDRSPDIAVTQEMLQVVRCAEDMEILLKRLRPDTSISTDVVTAISKIELGEENLFNLPVLEEAYLTMRPLLKFDPSIRLDHKMALHMVRPYNGIDALEMLLEHDPSMPVTEEMFLRIFGLGHLRIFGRGHHGDKFADLLHKFGKRLVFTDEMREVIDQAYCDQSEAAKRERFYSLGVNDENGTEPEGNNKKRKRSRCGTELQQQRRRHR